MKAELKEVNKAIEEQSKAVDLAAAKMKEMADFKGTGMAEMYTEAAHSAQVAGDQLETLVDRQYALETAIQQTSVAQKAQNAEATTQTAQTAQMKTGIEGAAFAMRNLSPTS